MKQLWETGLSDFKGEVFQMGNRKLSPPSNVPIKLVSAGQSDRGMEFAAQYCDFNFALGEGVNHPTKAAGVGRGCEPSDQGRRRAGADAGTCEEDRPRCRQLHARHDHRP